MNDRIHPPSDDLLDRAFEALRTESIPGEPPQSVVSSTVEAIDSFDTEPAVRRRTERRKMMFRIARYSAAAAAALLLCFVLAWTIVIDRGTNVAEDVPENIETPSNKNIVAPEQTRRKQQTTENSIGFRRIANVDGWSLERLKKAGISISSWKHDLQFEDPPLEWIQVTFDCSQCPADQDVVMTVWLTNNENVSSAAVRAERLGNNVDEVRLLFARNAPNVNDSHCDIIIWDQTPGGSGGYGYTLSTERIIHLSRANTVSDSSGF